MRVGIVSGYFNPIHIGHIDYINAAKEQCDYLLVIVNNDDQVKLKKAIPFMDEYHRCEILQNLKSVDNVIISRDYSYDVCDTIKYIKSEFPNDKLIFFNSGDRIGNNIDSSERTLCKSLDIDFIVLPLPKKYSSSGLIQNSAEVIRKKRINESIEIKVKTLFPVAIDSPDHINPVGTKNDNNTNLKLISEIEKYFNKSIKFLDIGCSGGQFAVDFFERGHLSVGIEGSDYSLKHKRANWPDYHGKVLFTCDASKEYFITDDKNCLITFDCISSWEVIEHINPTRLNQFFANIRNHMHQNSIFIGSISLYADNDKLHQSVFPVEIWKDVIMNHYFHVYDYPFNEKVRSEKTSFIFLAKPKLSIDKIKI